MHEFAELFLVKWILYVYSIVIIQVFGASVHVPIVVRLAALPTIRWYFLEF